MKKILLSLVVLSLSACATEIYKTDFSEDVLENKDWIAENDGGRAIVEYDAENNGSIHIMASERVHALAYHKLHRLNPNTLYRMSAKLHTKGVAEGRGAILAVRYDDSDQIWNASEFVYGDNDWKEVYIDFFPSADGYAEICCQLGNFGGTYNGGTSLGEVWWDDVSVRKVSEDEIYFLKGEHINLAIDRDKVCVPDSVMKAWLSNLDKVYESYTGLVGAKPYGGRPITVLTTPGIEAGYWALAGNPILWNNHVNISQCLQKTMDNDDWNFGVLHEIGHTFSPGTAADRGEWNWNDELFANFRMAYALEECDGAVSQRDVLYRGAEIIDYYKIFYDEIIGRGLVKNNGDVQQYTFMRIKEKYGWDVFVKAFHELYTADKALFANLTDDFSKFEFFLSYVSKYAGENVMTTCYTDDELRLIKASLQQ